MTDYLTQCNAITAEKKVWRWAKFTIKDGHAFSCLRSDEQYFAVPLNGWTRTEYDGDADGNPIQTMLGPKKYVIAADMHGWYIAFDEHTRRCFGFGDAAYSEAVILRDRLNAAAIAESGGNPAALGPQELWDRHRLYIDPERPPRKAWRIMRADDNNEWKCLTSSEPTYAAALAEANRIAGGA